MTDTPSSAPAPTRRDVLLPLAAAVWTLFVWGSRIRLLDDTEASQWANWLRISISLVLALGLLIVAIRTRKGRRSRRAAWVMIAFAVWMLIAWVPSLVGVLAGDESPAFKAVHSGLAIVSLALGAAVGSLARREALFYPSATSTQRAASNAAK